MGITDLKDVLEDILIEIKQSNLETNKTRKIIAIVNVVNIITLIVLVLLMFLR